MRITLQSKKLPTLIGLSILLVILTGGVFLVNRFRGFNLGATLETSPRQVRITNVGSSSFTVSWITQDKTTGLVEFGNTTSLGELKKDIRDKDRPSSEKYQTHYVIVDNLQPENKYYFKIVSGGASFDSSGKLFEVATGPLKVPGDNDIAQGKILTSDREPATGAIIYLSLANSITQSAITDSEGNWVIPLSTARNLDLKDFSNYDRSAQVEEIFVQGDWQTATSTLTTGNDNPAPEIILGQSYNFLNQPPQVTNTPPPTIKRTFAENLNPQTTSSSDVEGTDENIDPTIIFPSENENVNSLLPEFLGTGPKGKKLNIEVESKEQISSQTTSDPKGKWKWSPNTPLSPGTHKITVSYTDSKGFIRKAVRSFTVLATGTSDLPSFTATPSGQTTTPLPGNSPTPTISSAITRVPSITITPLASPSSTVSITPSTLSPTAIPTIPYRSTLPSTESGTPKPGTILPTKLFFSAGLAIILFGVALILF